MIARASAIIAITACALIGSTPAPAEMVLARNVMPVASKTVKAKPQLRRTRLRRPAHRRAPDQRRQAAARAMPSAPPRAADTPLTFDERFNAAFPTTKGD
jgi:hypothetical protein